MAPRNNGQLIGIHGHGNIRANICYDCKGPLKIAEGPEAGSFYERLANVEGHTFAAAICRECKRKDIEKQKDWHARDSKGNRK